MPHTLISHRPSAALPDGARPQDVDPWQPPTGSTPAYRCVHTPAAIITGIEVRGTVVQWADGTIATTGADAPHVFIDHRHYTVLEARALADAIHAGYDVASLFRGAAKLEARALADAIHAAADRVENWLAH